MSSRAPIRSDCAELTVDVVSIRFHRKLQGATDDGCDALTTEDRRLLRRKPLESAGNLLDVVGLEAARTTQLLSQDLINDC